MKRFEDYQDTIARLYPKKIKDNEDGTRYLSRPITFCVTNACQLRCTYCYEKHKGNKYMKFETAKKFIDLLLSGEKGMDQYINPEISQAVMLEFIGGEPFMAIDLMDQITDYWMDRTTELMHPWAEKFRISISSNGVAYFEPKVQEYLKKHANHLSLSVTIDGNKELHNACRVYAGTNIGCYDEAVAAAKDWMASGYTMGSKITIAPENLKYLDTAIIHMLDLGYEEIMANCVYEAEWSNEEALLFYQQGKKIADEFLKRNLDFENTYYCSLYEENFFKQKDESDIQNWCFPAGTMIMTPTGEKNINSLNIGDCVVTKNGIYPIENILIHNSDNLIKLKAAGMFETYVTAEHPYWVKKKIKNSYTDPMWIAAKDIQKSDKICLISNEFTNKKKIDKNLAYVVGRYIGDGWNSTTGYKICCAHDEVEDLQESLDLANASYSSYTYPTVKQFNIHASNTKLITLLQQCGKTADEKHLPIDIYNWSYESAYALLMGYLDADGYFDNNKQSYRCNTVSKQLAQELLDLIRSLGFFPLCSIDYRAGKSKILDREVNIKNRYEISFRPDKFSRFCESDEKNGNVWTTVSAIENLQETIEVYNLTVSTDHTFVANGAVVHNCGGTGLMIACDWDGEIYPCIRYMEMSLGDDQPKLPIGNVDDGLIQSPEHLKNLQCLQCIDRRTQSTDECFYCPIGEGCSWCFPAGTMILTPDGEKSIEKLSLGDMVITKDGIHPVESLLCRDSDNLVKIKALDMRDTVVTKEHPYWGKDKNSDNPRWIPVEELCEGDQICLKELSGKYKWTEVQSIEKLNEKNKVYNLTVSGDHSFVANGAIVHNCSAWNYQLYGTADKRCTRICPTHKARSMFNVYFWNKYYLKNNMKKYMEMNIPEEWALEIIPVEEYNMLKDLVRKAKEQYES